MSQLRGGASTPRSPFALLPLRTGVLFPGTLITLPVGRKRSVALVESLSTGDVIGVATQKDPKVVDPGAVGSPRRRYVRARGRGRPPAGRRISSLPRRARAGSPSPTFRSMVRSGPEGDRAAPRSRRRQRRGSPARRLAARARARASRQRRRRSGTGGAFRRRTGSLRRSGGLGARPQHRERAHGARRARRAGAAAARGSPLVGSQGALRGQADRSTPTSAKRSARASARRSCASSSRPSSASSARTRSGGRARRTEGAPRRRRAPRGGADSRRSRARGVSRA